MMNPYHTSALQEDTSYLARVAIILQRMVPNLGFSNELALVCAGMCFDRAQDISSSQAIEVQKRAMLNYPLPCYSLDDKTLLKRYKVFCSFAKRWPTSSSLLSSDSNLSRIDLQNLSDYSSTERSAAIRLIGGNELQSKSTSPFYSKCRRLDKKLFRDDDGKMLLGRQHLKIFIDPFKNFPIIESPPHPPQPPNLATLSHFNYGQQHSQQYGQQYNQQYGQQCGQQYGQQYGQQQYGQYGEHTLAHPPPAPNTNPGVQFNVQNQIISPALQSPMSDISTHSHSTPSQMSNIAKATSSVASSCRRTAFQAQAKRKDEAEDIEKRNIAFQLSTIVVKMFKDRKISWFKSPTEIVNAINGSVVKLEGAASTSEVCKAVNENRIGKPPRKKGTKGKLPHGAFEALCDLIFTMTAITQHNGDSSLTRIDIINMLDSIISPYFVERETIGMNKRELHNRIQNRNATRMGVAFRNQRENLRWRWFTFHNQLKHYVNFEKFSVEKGFARWSTEEEYERTRQKTIWSEAQRARYINVDEISFSLGYGDNGVGGREAARFVVEGIKDSGEEEQKSSFKCTFLFGMNAMDEALPPLIILPTAAMNPRIKKTLLSRLPQVEGKYGLTERKRYNFWIATSANGSMNSHIMESYIENLVELVPDARDEFGFRICKKVDSGPGRKGKLNKVNFTAKQYGIHVYPGLPNSTEGTQEMDQVFSYLKTKMEINRSLLQRALSRAGMGHCSAEHLPIILCGGEFKLENGEVITLENAFVKALSKEHLKRAREKCGYVPSTRNALYHPKCRRDTEDEVELAMGVPETNEEMMELINRIDSIYLESGQINTDGYKEMVLRIQERHYESIRVLVDLGFKSARMGQRALKENEIDIGAESSSGVTTVQGTRERQNLLQKASRAGEFYRVTNGGASLGCDDMLIAMERSRMEAKAKDLQKNRKELIVKLQTRRIALEILEDGGQPRRIDELKACIMWKSGVTKKPIGKRNDLITLWGTLKDQPDPIGLDNETVDQLDKNIERLERGDIREVKETGLFKRAYARKCRILHEQGMFLGEPERVELLASLLLSLSDEGKQKLNNLQESIGSNTEYVPACIDYNSDDDDLRPHGDSHNNDEDSNYSIHSVGVLDGGSHGVEEDNDYEDSYSIHSVGVLVDDGDFEHQLPLLLNDEMQVGLVDDEGDECSLHSVRIFETNDGLPSPSVNHNNSSSANNSIHSIGITDDELSTTGDSVPVSCTCSGGYSTDDASSSNDEGDECSLHSVRIFETNDGLPSPSANHNNSSSANNSIHSIGITDDELSTTGDSVPVSSCGGYSTDDASPSSSIQYEDMDLEELIQECQCKNIKANRRFAKQTLITKLLRFSKEEEQLRLSQGIE